MIEIQIVRCFVSDVSKDTDAEVRIGALAINKMAFLWLTCESSNLLVTTD